MFAPVGCVADCGFHQGPAERFFDGLKDRFVQVEAFVSHHLHFPRMVPRLTQRYHGLPVRVQPCAGAMVQELARTLIERHAL